MKKAFLLIYIFIISILSVSCIHDLPADYQFTNNTSYEVTLASVYDEYITLKPGEVILYKGHYQTGYNITDKTLRIKEVYHVGKNTKITYISIENMESYMYYPFNKSNYIIHIYEKNNLIGENYGDTYFINPGETIALKSYTTNPEYILYYYIDNQDYKQADLSELIF